MDHSQVQQLYSFSLRKAAMGEMDRLFRQSENASITYRAIQHFLAHPSLRHSVAQGSPTLRVVVAELSQCSPQAMEQFMTDLAAHVREQYGGQAAAVEHTNKVERVLERLQQRNLDRMTN